MRNEVARGGRGAERRRVSGPGGYRPPRHRVHLTERKTDGRGRYVGSRSLRRRWGSRACIPRRPGRSGERRRERRRRRRV